MNYQKISVAFVATALALTSFLAPLSTPAQSSSAADIVLVLPFENVSNHPGSARVSLIRFRPSLISRA